MDLFTGANVEISCTGDQGNNNLSFHYLAQK